MMNEELGSDEKFYHSILKDIIPRLKTCPPKEYSQYVKRLSKGIGIGHEIDEDIDAIFNDLVRRVGGKFEIKEYSYNESPERGYIKLQKFTPYGLLRKDVNNKYLELSKAGFVRYGRKRNKEHIILLLISDISNKKEYKDIAPVIETHLTLEEKEKRGEGLKRYIIKLAKSKRIHIPPSIFDKHSAVVFDYEKWYQSFRDDLVQYAKEKAKQDIDRLKILAGLAKGALAKGIRDADLFEKTIKQYIESCADIDYQILKLPDNEGTRRFMIGKIITHTPRYRKQNDKSQVPDYPMTNINNPIANNWLTLLSYIWDIKCFEKIEGEKLLKSDPELRKIWNVPKETWRQKTAFFSIDK